MIRRIIVRLVSSVVFLGLLVAVLPIVISTMVSRNRTFDVDTVSGGSTVIVFGASANADGTPSAYLRGRLDVAAELFKQGKASSILVSGYRSEDGYDEPEVMLNYLVGRGVPAVKIAQDSLGNDTYSTCYRAKNTYGVGQAILVTQNYHLPRAIATCLAAGIDAVGVPDVTQPKSWTWWKGAAREVLGNIKMAWDIVTRRTVDTSGDRNAVADAQRPR